MIEFGKVLAREQRVRMDAQGSGLWHASRVDRLHKGLDIEVFPNEEVFSPIAGAYVRTAQPYPEDSRFGGIVIAGKWCTVLLYYLSVLPFAAGEYIRRGDPIGRAQDVSLKYPPKKPGGHMKPHIHIEIAEVDPQVFFGQSPHTKG